LGQLPGVNFQIVT